MLNKIKLFLLKTTQKTIIIGILSFFIVTSFHSSLIHAATVNNDSFEWSYGEVEMSSYTFDSLTNIVVNGTTFRSSGVIYIDIYMPVYRTGTIKLLFSTLLRLPNLIGSGTFIVEGGVFTEFNTSEDYIYINVSNVNHVKIVYTANDTSVNTYINNASHSTIGFSGISLIPSSGSVESSVNDIDVKLSSMELSMQQLIDNQESNNIIDKWTLGVYNSLDYKLGLSRNEFDYQAYYWYASYNYFYDWCPITVSVDQSYSFIFDIGFNTVTQSYYYLRLPLFDTSEMIYPLYIPDPNDNVIYRFDLHCKKINGVPNFKIEVHKLNLDTVTESIVTTPTIWRVYITNYDITTEQLLEANNEKLDSLINIMNQMLYGDGDVSSITDNIDQTSSDFDDAASQSSAIEDQYISDLTDFKNNLDLSDYDFSLHSNSGFTYLKEKLQDIYEINEFKPFYLVPIIFMVLTVILGG